MDKQINKIDDSLNKVLKGIKKSINWDFKNNWLILEYLTKRQKSLEKTKRKLIKFNKQNLISWEIPENNFIS